MTVASVGRLAGLVWRRPAVPTLSVVVTRGRGLLVEVDHGSSGLRPRRAASFVFDEEDLTALETALFQTLALSNFELPKDQFCC